ncbi:hypothetical protein C1646_806513 [Rhizophagus diaphanus]|nr:hypothetical protein C1646_806513 [Rhizophagus diaphanus] [Rhizophagus sp. MUCL 43196]
MDEIIQIDEKIDDEFDIDNDKPHNDNPVTNIGKPHSGKPITKMEVSPNEICLVTYSHEDRSFFGWYIKDIDESPLKLESLFKLSEEANFDLHSMCISDNNELVYISKNGTLKIYDMKNGQKIKLNWSNCKSYDYCTFNLVDIQLSMLDKYPTLFPLFIDITSNGFTDSIMKQNDLLPKESYRVTSKHIFRFIDGNVLKIDLDDVKINEEMSKMYDHLYILLLDSYVDTVRKLFQEAITNYDSKYKLKASRNSIEWKITCKDYKIELQVFKNDVSICMRDIEFVGLTEVPSLLGFKLINDDIIILTSIGPLIFHFNENDKSISLSYYYYIILNSSSKDNTKLLQIFSKPTLPLPNHESFKYNAKWVLDVKNNKESLLKYGVELFKFAINEHKVELVEKIYKKCIDYFEEDFNNIMFLSIINSNLPLLDKYYPDYIFDYSLETAIIVDSPSYDRVNSLHLSSFQFPQIDIQFKALIERVICSWNYFRSLNIVLQILALIPYLIIIPMALTYFILLLILGIFYKIIRFINFDFITSITKKTPSFIFTSPYINFVNYPKDYNWFSELFLPQPSPFIETINRDIYKTWSGEALLNYKWNKYGRRYHGYIWSGYLILLVCFNVAAGISQQEYIDIQKILLIISTIFGFIHLSFEVRQLIYGLTKGILNSGKIYGKNYNHFREF